MSAFGEGDGESARDMELLVLTSMYEECLVVDAANPFAFIIYLEDLETPDSVELPASLSLHMSLAADFPSSPPSLQVQSKDLSKSAISVLSKRLSTHMVMLDPEEYPNLTLEAINFCTELIANDSSLISKQTSIKKQDGDVAEMNLRNIKNRRGFMREWSSFVSLYKDSYISGPNRFEVLTSLAKERGLAITGLAISGKPGGIVVEGPEGDVDTYMSLLRTEFFETLNPRGRKCTTRWQQVSVSEIYASAFSTYLTPPTFQRFPKDKIVDRFDVAEALVKMEELKSGREDSSLSELKRNMKNEQVKKLEELITNWEGRGNAIEKIEGARDIVNTGLTVLLGQAPELTETEINGLRIFEDFNVFVAGSDGYETSTSEAAKLFQKMDQMEGFRSMFDYRFS